MGGVRRSHSRVGCGAWIHECDPGRLRLAVQGARTGRPGQDKGREEKMPLFTHPALRVFVLASAFAPMHGLAPELRQGYGHE